LLKHGIFTSEQDLAEQMLAFIETYNQTAKPFAWTYTGMVLNAGDNGIGGDTTTSAHFSTRRDSRG